MSIEFTTRIKGEVTIVDAVGRLTLGQGTSELRRTVRGLLDAGSKRILLNMAGVTYMDSSGMGELVATYTTVINLGGELKLMNLGRRLGELLTVTKLYTVFEMFEDEATAMASFLPPGQAEIMPQSLSA